MLRVQSSHNGYARGLHFCAHTYVSALGAWHDQEMSMTTRAAGLEALLRSLPCERNVRMLILYRILFSNKQSENP